MICAHCSKEFDSSKRRRKGAKYCGLSCSNRAKHKPFDAEMVRSLAVAGVTARKMRSLTGIDETRLRRQLRRMGIYRQWTLARFKKAQVAA
jgi:hypothetical protein